MRERTLLTIAGTDPWEGAGVVADLRVANAFGLSTLVLETAIVDQDPLGVYDFEPVSAGLFERRLRRVLDRGAAQGIKIGMTADPALVEVLARSLAGLGDAAGVCVVLDPVLAGGTPGGGKLGRGEMAQALRALLAHTTLVTPNAQELALLAGTEVPKTVEEAERAALALLDLGAGAVLLKGGHLEPRGFDWLVRPCGTRELVYAGEPWAVDVHGTGCHLSTAITSLLIRGEELSEACKAASAWLHGLVAADALIQRGAGRAQFDPRRLTPALSHPS